MKKIQLNALNDAVRLLDAIGAKYRIECENEVRGDLKLEPQVIVKRRRTRGEYGEVAKLVKPLILNAKVGDVVIIPKLPGRSIGNLQTAATAVIGYTWGKGTYKSCINKANSTLEVLRVA